MPKVDIVVPCYNYGRFLAACVRSVLDQSVKDLRVLIIDDASSDDSLSVATKLAEADPRVSVISHPHNRGHINTYNEGIAWASAEYFLLLSADDMLIPGALERATRIMDAHPDIVLTHGKCIPWLNHRPLPDFGDNCSAGWAREDLIRRFCRAARNVVFTPSVIVRTSVQNAIGGYRPALPHSGDMEMWLRFAANGAVARIDAVQAIYRIHVSNMNNSYSYEEDYKQRKACFDTFFADCADRIPMHANLHAQSNRVLSEKIYWIGIAHICSGHIKHGRALIRFAIDVNPGLRYLPPVMRLMLTPISGYSAFFMTLGRRRRALVVNKSR